MPDLQKSDVMRVFCLPPWVNLLHNQPADSFAIQPVAPIGAGPLYMQPRAASLRPPAPRPVLATFATQLIKTTAESWILYCMYYTRRHKLEGFPRRISLSRQFFLHPQYSSKNDSPSPHENKTVLAIITSLYKLHYLCLSRGHRYLLRQIFEIRTIRIRGQ